MLSQVRSLKCLTGELPGQEREILWSCKAPGLTLAGSMWCQTLVDFPPAVWYSPGFDLKGDLWACQKNTSGHTVACWVPAKDTLSVLPRQQNGVGERE